MKNEFSITGKMGRTFIAILVILSVLLSAGIAAADEEVPARHDDDQKSDGSDIFDAGTYSLMDSDEDGLFTICIDPGHGGSEPGSILFNGGYEKDTNLKIGLYLKDALEQYIGVKVVMTRTQDTNVSLADRAQTAADGGADFLISIHSDAYDGQARGISIFYPNEHYSKSISDAGYKAAVNVRKELMALGLEEFQGILTRSIDADDEDLQGAGGQRTFTYPATDSDRELGIKIYSSDVISGYQYTLGDYYGVIRNAKRLGIPAIIVEHGFGDNHNDYDSFLSSDEKLRRLAEADARALAETYGLLLDESVFDTPGWHKVNGIWYYAMEPGELARGWKKIDYEWYYFYSTHAMATGWLLDGNTWYFLKDSGAMVKGWMKTEGSWYFMNASGSMVTGWKKIDRIWYYFRNSGAMATGWLNRGVTWYYLNSSGAMAVGWKKVNGAWYFFKDSGAMATGWLQVGSEWYYLDASGAMVTGNRTIGGKDYYFNSLGVLVD